MTMQPRTKIGAWASGGFAILAVVYFFPPAEHTFYPRCPFYACTHLLCPGCGGTRALYELLHMNLRGALHYNALLTALAPLVLVWAGWACYQTIRNGAFPQMPWPRTIAVCLGLISISFAIVRDAGIAFTL